MAGVTRTRPSVIERAQQGDWDDFVRLYPELLHRMAHKQGVSDQDADDFVQDIMTELIQTLPHFQYDQQRGSFKGWLKLIVWRRVVDRRRRPSLEVEDRPLDKHPAPSPDFDELYENEWRKTRFLHAWDLVRKEFKPTTLQSFQLCAMQGLSAEEAAKMLGLTPAAVRQNKRRVLQRLKEIAEEADHDSGPTENNPDLP